MYLLIMLNNINNKFKKYKDNGLSGLINLGNTCFINSCIQVLSHSYEVNNLLDEESFKSKLKNNDDALLLIEWDNLRKLLWSKNCIISPGRFIQIIHQTAVKKNNNLFNDYNQNDISEFLLFIIDCFHNALSRKVTMTISGVIQNDYDVIAKKCYEMIRETYENEYSEIWNLFYGISITEITNENTNKIISIKPEPFFIINLPIPCNTKNVSLLDCFNSYVECEVVENFRIDDTNESVTIKKNIKFWSFPKILVIDLKRFNNYNLQKNQLLIDFPIEELDLTNYVIGYNNNIYKYELYAICNHSGSVSGGHYYTYIRNANNKWYNFNDNVITEINDIKILISTKAYVLFYRIIE